MPVMNTKESREGGRTHWGGGGDLKRMVRQSDLRAETLIRQLRGILSTQVWFEYVTKNMPVKHSRRLSRWLSR